MTQLTPGEGEGVRGISAITLLVKLLTAQSSIANYGKIISTYLQQQVLCVTVPGDKINKPEGDIDIVLAIVFMHIMSASVRVIYSNLT